MSARETVPRIMTCLKRLGYKVSSNRRKIVAEKGLSLVVIWVSKEGRIEKIFWRPPIPRELYECLSRLAH